MGIRVRNRRPPAPPKQTVCGQRLDNPFAAIHAVCLLDPDHRSPDHWGLDRQGVFRQWR